MSSLKTTYKELTIPYFKEVFQIIDEVLTEHGTPYYLIGASAIALEMLKYGIKPARGTKDIDFALMISHVDEYDIILDSFIKHGFVKVAAPWTIRHPDYKIIIDLLPFGKIEDNFSVNFKDKDIDLHVLGFTEVMEDSITVEIEEKIAKIPSLHGMVILKLVSWSDRPEERKDDLYDILLILDKYFEMYDEEIYEYHNDLFEDDKDNLVLISARVLGRKAAEILAKSDRLKNRIFKVLNENIQDPKNSKIAEKWAIEHDKTIEYAISLLEELRIGIIEKLK